LKETEKSSRNGDIRRPDHPAVLLTIDLSRFNKNRLDNFTTRIERIDLFATELCPSAASFGSSGLAALSFCSSATFSLGRSLGGDGEVIHRRQVVREPP
jgi:hypothetical protein